MEQKDQSKREAVKECDPSFYHNPNVCSLCIMCSLADAITDQIIIQSLALNRLEKDLSDDECADVLEGIRMGLNDSVLKLISRVVDTVKERRVLE